MKEDKYLLVKEVMKLAKIDNRRRLMLWEDYGILHPERAKNKNKDRRYTMDDVKFIIWVKRLMKNGYSIDTIKILVEYYQTGKIKSVQWYK